MDKEIIIDGVNVVGCSFYQIEANELYPKAQYCGSMRNTFCENEPNCYYKQLKRLEQENAELKAENKELAHYLACMTEQRNKANTYLQEIKAIAETCISKDGCFECKYSDDCNIEDAEFPTYDICKLLIQKITKAEEE